MKAYKALLVAEMVTLLYLMFGFLYLLDLSILSVYLVAFTLVAFTDFCLQLYYFCKLCVYILDCMLCCFGLYPFNIPLMKTFSVKNKIK